jgi:hypothetical protein
MRAAVIDVQRGTRNHHAVIGFETAAVGQIGAGIGRVADVDCSLRQELAQEFGITLARCLAAGGLQKAASVGGVSLDDEQAGGRH